MTKKRVLVMNGTRIVQSDHDGEWACEKVEKARGLKAGIYNIYRAIPADKEHPNSGVIVHADKEAVYQQCGQQCVVHSCQDFDVVPSIGSMKDIEYNGDNWAVITDSFVEQAHSRSR